MSKLALFGGSFDPPHFGHLNLAVEALEQKGFEKVLWIPANHSPFKEEATSPEHRLEMVRLCTAPIPQFEVLDIEVKRGGPSFTIDTLDALGCDPKTHTLLLADDAYQFFSKWKDVERIKQRVEILVVRRDKVGMVVPILEISATRIRERLKNDLYCGHLLPGNVLDYISMHQLYSNP